VNCRQLHITAYADEGTRLFFEANNTRCFGLIKPEAMKDLGSILSCVEASFSIARLKMVKLNSSMAAHFSCASGTAVALEVSVLGDHDVQSRWDSVLASQRGALYGSIGTGSAHSDATLLDEPFLAGKPRGAVTCCVIKPHAIQAGQVGALLTAIDAEGFTVEAMEMLHMDKDSAANFFDVYKGVLPYYAPFVASMTEGPVIYLKLSGYGDGVVEAFREACGPSEVELAKTLRPKSIRARYGTDRVLNCLHCTDLPADGSLECGYFDHLLTIDC